MKSKLTKKRILLIVMFAVYLLAGINHFRNPEDYLRIIPPYLGDADLINTLAGIAEIILALLLLLDKTRRWACYGIIAMLMAFIPTHIFMIQTGFCPELAGKIRCAPGWSLWLRLIIFQPLLILWAWSLRKYNTAFNRR